MSGGGRFDADRLARLEEERRFLLRSIRDLDAEYGAGDVDGDDYTTLRDGYVARVADVLRQIDDDRSAVPSSKRRPGRTVAIAAITLAIGAGAGWAVSAGSGDRRTGQTSSGGLPSDAANAVLSEASALMSRGDFAGAQRRYEDALALDPGNAEAETYRQWLLVVQSQALSDGERTAVIDEARTVFVAVIDSNPAYADPSCFLTLVEGSDAFNPTPNLQAAAESAQACLDANPPGELRAVIEQFLLQAGAPALTTP
jgi:tetratricopeptide (TPR) repeat protein